jgi:pyruvyltransferase
VSAVRLYWWRPTRPARRLAREVHRHGPQWARLYAHSGRTLRNFGDELSPLLLARLLGRPARWAGPESASVAAIGSILVMMLEIQRPVGDAPVVWGSGLRDPRPALDVHRRPVRYAAVRGPLTRDRLGLPTGTPLGDPALLAPLCLPAPRRRRSSAVVLVPHFADYQHGPSRQTMATLAAQGVVVLPPSWRPERVLDALNRAGLVLASALHGLICADAYGVPAVPARLDAGHDEPLFKYQDYARSVGLDHRAVAVTGAGRDALAPARELAERRRAVLDRHVSARQHDLMSALDSWLR